MTGLALPDRTRSAPAITLLGSCALLASCAMFRPPMPDIIDVDEGRFEKVVLAEGMKQPMEFEILPDGRVLFVELPGDIKVYDPETREVSVVGKLEVFTDMENGLLGLALDPDFERNRWIYLFHSPVGGEPRNLVSRFVFDGGRVDVESETLVIEIPTQRDQCCHQAGALEFGPDGTLYITVGDNTNPFDSDGFSPSDYREGRSPWDAAKSSGNTNDLRGKILRIRPEPEGGYSIPEGNLFPPDDPECRPEIYVMGNRNPFRHSIDPATGYLYWGEVGPDSRLNSDRGPRGYDEINQAREAGNFGWPFLIADNKAYAAWDFEKKELGEKFDPAGPANLSPNNTGRRTLPPGVSGFIWYPYTKSREFPVVGEGGRTACAGPVYHHDPALYSLVKIPPQFDNCLFIYDWERGWIKAVKLDANSDIEWMRDFMAGHKFLRPVDMQFGPEGDLYLLEYGETWGANDDAKLVRLQYRAGNREPVAVAKGENIVGRHPLTVRFSSDGSLDKDGDPIRFRWKFGTGGLIESGSKDPAPGFTYRKPGVYTARLRVYDNHGAFGESEVRVLVGNDPPELEITSPGDGAFFDWDRPIPYSVRVRDAEDGDTKREDYFHKEVFLHAAYHGGKPERGEDGLWKVGEEPPGLRLMKKSNCFNCHAVDRRVVGPSFREIVERYKTDIPAAIEVATGRVIEGSTGVWGQEMAMLPHKDNSREEIREMVNWVFSLNQGGASGNTHAGVEGETEAFGAPENGREGFVILTAAYRDQGAEGAERIERRTQTLLRNRRIGAEFHDEMNGVLKHGATDEGKGETVAGIEPGDWIMFRDIHMDGVAKLTYRTASAGAGGRIELRLGAPDGPLVAATEIAVTGGWQDWISTDQEIRTPGGVHDVYFVFTNDNPEAAGLFNLNWIEFHPGAVESDS